MQDLSFGDLYTAWLVLFTIVFSIRGFARARNDESDIARQLGWAAAYAAVAAAFFTAAQWLAIRAAAALDR